MSDSPASPHFQLQAPPQIKKRPQSRGRSRQEVLIHQDHLGDSYLELRDLEPQPVLMNDWIKMKIEVPKIYLGILYTNMLASLFT